jgi:hypothetical protein
MQYKSINHWIHSKKAKYIEVNNQWVVCGAVRHRLSPECGFCKFLSEVCKIPDGSERKLHLKNVKVAE